MIVIDASALTKYVFKEGGWREVRKALEEEVISVDHVVKEVANTIWKKCVVLKLEPVDVATSAINSCTKLSERESLRWRTSRSTSKRPSR